MVVDFHFCRLEKESELMIDKYESSCKFDNNLASALLQEDVRSADDSLF